MRYFIILLLLSLNLSAQSLQVAQVPAVFKDCFFCGLQLGSNNPDRHITDLAVVGKPSSEGLGSSFEPEDLVDIDPRFMTPLYRESIINLAQYEKLKRPAYEALQSLLNKAKQQGLDLFIHSAYRSYENQCRVFVGKVKKEIIKKILNINQSEDVKKAIFDVNTRSALPGQSEHQLGTVVDLVTFLPQYEIAGTPKYSGYAVAYEIQNTPEFRWLSENADQFGFVLSYPYSQVAGYFSPHPKTGYIYEPWHWRYIGVRYAKQFKQCGAMVLREYLKNLEADPNFECLQTRARL